MSGIDNLYKPPADTELEVSLFGPGYGESVLVHLGWGEWIVVDSCLNKESGVPAPFHYLENLPDHDPCEDIYGIVSSHWHRDHTAGLSYLVKNCPAAKFICPESFGTDVFKELVYSYKQGPLLEESEKKEYYQVFKALSKRPEKTKVPKFTGATDRLWYREGNGEKIGGEIHALSPSDKDQTKAIEKFEELKNEYSFGERIPSIEENHSSIVLQGTIGKYTILLGSDLETNSERGSGWTCILNSETRSREKASIFKVPHHGSENGFHEEVWDQMLVSNPIAILTPFTRLEHPRPRKGDVKRILGKTNKGYITAGHRETTDIRNRTVQKKIDDSTIQFQEVDPDLGQIRLRTDLTDSNEDWKVELFKAARALEDSF